MKKRVASFLLITLIVSSCNISNNKTPTGHSFVVDIRDTINRSKALNELIEREQKNEKRFFSKWLMYSLENGVDSFELRFKETGNFYSQGPIFYSIKRLDTQIIGQYVFSRWDDTLRIVPFTPKCGWKLFMDSLKFFNFYNMPSQNEIKGFQDNMLDGTFIEIEYATNRLYRRISYHEPEYFKDSVNRKFWAFLLMWNRNIPNRWITGRSLDAKMNQQKP